MRKIKNNESDPTHLPQKQGLYDPRYEHDSCGMGFIANIENKKNHKIIQDGLIMLKNFAHRGAVGADPKAGDGVGLLTQIPDELFRKTARSKNITLPKIGAYGVGMFFLPKEEVARKKIQLLAEKMATYKKHKILFWRDVPVDNSDLGDSVLSSEPHIAQLVVANGKEPQNQEAFERDLFIIRRYIRLNVDKLHSKAVKDFFYVPSFSSRTITYKAMVLGRQLGAYYKDLQNPLFESALVMVHQRFSTNTFPSWKRCQPLRMICHNGEINTIRGNINWMKARAHSLQSDIFGRDLETIWPLIDEWQSDSGAFDNAVELLTQAGFKLAHALIMLVPEAWKNHQFMNKKIRDFYKYHSMMMEPWDGPAAMAFTDGRQVGATLDRNGLRPARYYMTDDHYIMMASEAGVLPVDERKIVKKWRLQPGKILLVDLEEKRIISDKEIKDNLSRMNPYGDWIAQTTLTLDDLPESKTKSHLRAPLLNLQQTFGYTQEDVKMFLLPMAQKGEDPVGAMGTDIALSVLSDRPKLLYSYFKQLFAQVTNPPIDPIREQLVMSLTSMLGAYPNLLGLKTPPSGKRVFLETPILTDAQLRKLETKQAQDKGILCEVLDICYEAPQNEGHSTRASVVLKKAIKHICQQAENAIDTDKTILILSDRNTDKNKIAIPALLAVSCVHHHLIRKGKRTNCGIVIETGEAREVHHMCCLAGYGANAINPYLAFASLEQLMPDRKQDAIDNYIKALNKGILKVMSKMGISTYQSYCGAQIFDAVGLEEQFIENYFTGTNSAVAGIGMSVIAIETFRRHRRGFGRLAILEKELDVGGEHNVRVRGEQHMWDTQTISDLQHSVRGNERDKYQSYAKTINEQSKQLMTLRGMFRIKNASEIGRKPIPLADVEPAKEIVKRFATGAMSFGSISDEAHSSLAIAMNRIGGQSNTGEGGEETERFLPLANGDSKRSAIKQVASGRFGVTTNYLVNADMLQIKIAQGAKPGEGGQLPGHKVDERIAKVRHSTAGVGLISPPPHHDIYSIEDLAQLIFDLKNANEKADISVKLVSEIGVGTVAAGVVKAKADHITIAGCDGGTGASPLTSIKHAGEPWEIGLSETQQTLLINGLRSRTSLQVDGGLRTGRDVVIGGLLGADGFGFATAPLIALGCIMMRKCHLNTCPVGIATQDKVLRKRFTGQPEHVINFFFFIAEEVRLFMAKLGVARFDELIGQTDFLDTEKAITHWKAQGLDFTNLLTKPKAKRQDYYRSKNQNHEIKNVLDRALIKQAQKALEKKQPVKIKTNILNTDRSTGTMLSGEVARKYGGKGLPDDSIHIQLFGTAGQSFGAFLAKGITMELQGDANDYVGKGLAGGRLIIYPPKQTAMAKPARNIVIGNTVLYGATSGECYFKGMAGERFAVRNSGAFAVVEGAGDHCCEYMTGGCVLVLGKTGRNFAAGMSGGVAYVLDENDDFALYCNKEMVEITDVENEKTNQLGELNEHMERFDAERIYKMLKNHVHYTHSRWGRHLLENWETTLPKLKKVMPIDYKNALTQLVKKQRSPKQKAQQEQIAQRSI